MARYKPLISREKLDCSLIESSFADTPHDFYLLYDAIADELVIKLIKPENPTSLYYFSEDVSLIVDIQTYKVVGMAYIGFQEKYLPKWTELMKVWYKRNLPEHFHLYQKIRYIPEHEPEPEKLMSAFFAHRKIDVCRELEFA